MAALGVAFYAQTNAVMKVAFPALLTVAIQATIQVVLKTTRRTVQSTQVEDA